MKKTTKRLLALLCAVLMLLPVLHTAQATMETTGTTKEGLEYSIIRRVDGLKFTWWTTITGYIGPDNEVIIPEEIDGKPVTSIGESAFAGCTNLTSITIPKSVTSIGDGAFAGSPVTIRGYLNSKAHQYAIDNSIPFEPLDAPAEGDFLVFLYVLQPTVQEGEPITAHARADDPSGLPFIFKFTWYCVKNNETFMVLEDTNSEGVSTLPHPFGDSGWVEVSTKDAKGRSGTWQQDEFTVTGGTPKPLLCLAQTDKQIIEVGEEITGYAIVEGGTPPYSYYYIWEITEQGQTHRFVGVPSMEEENTQTIPYGERGSFSFGVQDSVGRTGSAEQPFEFGIFGATPNPLQGTATVNKKTVAIGEEFQVSVDVTGGEAPYQFTYTFDYDPPDDYEDVRSDSPTLTHKLFKMGSWYLSIRVRDTFGRVLMLDEIEIVVSKEQFPPGDANEDGVVDILDLIEIINYIVYGTSCRSMLNADANGDGIVDILDLVWIINKIIAD